MHITSPHASCRKFPIFESRHESIAENRYQPYKNDIDDINKSISLLQGQEDATEIV